MIPSSPAAAMTKIEKKPGLWAAIKDVFVAIWEDLNAPSFDDLLEEALEKALAKEEENFNKEIEDHKFKILKANKRLLALQSRIRDRNYCSACGWIYFSYPSDNFSQCGCTYGNDDYT